VSISLRCFFLATSLVYCIGRLFYFEINVLIEFNWIVSIFICRLDDLTLMIGLQAVVSSIVDRYISWICSGYTLVLPNDCIFFVIQVPILVNFETISVYIECPLQFCMLKFVWGLFWGAEEGVNKIQRLYTNKIVNGDMNKILTYKSIFLRIRILFFCGRGFNSPSLHWLRHWPSISSPRQKLIKSSKDVHTGNKDKITFFFSCLSSEE